MTKVSYDIIHNGKVIKNVVGYQEAVDICTALGSGWSFRAVYKEFDPHRTPEYVEACKAHAEKIRQAIFEKSLKHAPSYLNA